MVFDLLHLFVQNPHQVLTHQSLLDAVWRSHSVSDSVVARAVMKARIAINSSATVRAMVIQTVPRVGYRLVAQVSIEHHSAAVQYQLISGAPNAYQFAVLPFAFTEGLCMPDWVRIGLAALLRFELSNRLGWVCAPTQDVIEACGTEGVSDSDIDRIRKILGATECICCNLHMSNGVLVLRVSKSGIASRESFGVTGGIALN